MALNAFPIFQRDSSSLAAGSRRLSRNLRGRRWAAVFGLVGIAVGIYFVSHLDAFGSTNLGLYSRRDRTVLALFLLTAGFFSSFFLAFGFFAGFASCFFLATRFFFAAGFL